MDVVLRTPNGEAELSLGPGHQAVSVADLLEQVTGRRPDQLVYVDGRAVPAHTSLGESGALSGSTISTIDDVTLPPSDAAVEIVQVAGLGAGARIWLPPGRYRIGAGRRLAARELALGPVDRSVLRVEVATGGRVTVVADGASCRIDGRDVPSDRPVEWSGGLLDVDGRVFSLGRRDPRASVAAGHRLAGSGVDGTATFNRPPRPTVPNEPPPLALPQHRGRQRGGATSRADRGALASFRTAAAARRLDDRARARAAHPDIAAVALMAETIAPELWERRPGHADAFHVPVGLADLDWTPAIVEGPDPIAAATSVMADLGPLALVPVTVDLLAERGLGVVGGTEFCRAVARGLMLESAAIHGPADLDIVVLSSPEHGATWEWAKWLPHTRGSGGARLFTAADEVSGWVAAVRRGWDRGQDAAHGHLTLVVVDEPSWWRDRSALLRPLLGDASMPLRYVALAAHSAEVPAVCSTVITEAGDGRAVVDRLGDRHRVPNVHPYLASEELALRAARRLAPLDDPDVPLAADSPLPSLVPILDLLGLTEPTRDGILERWGHRDPGGLGATIGVTEHGPLRLDVDADGPHLLIAGAADSGKSELLRNLVVTLAAEAAPDEVTFLLADATPGTTFGVCASLPHTVGVINELDPHLAGRLVRCLRAEIRRRAGSADGPSPPRLVVVVDDVAPIATARPDLVPALIDIADRGRALGIHLVLATRHPAGIVDDQVRRALTIRIALRLQDDGDSIAVIDDTAAAHLPRVPGRACARIGSTTTMFHAVFSGGTTMPGVTHRVAFEPYVVARDLAPLERRLVRLAGAGSPSIEASGPGRPDEQTPTDLARLVDAIRDAGRDVDRSRVPRPCPDPLPMHLPADAFRAAHPGDAIPYGLADLVDEQRQAPLWWSPDADGGVAVYGSAGSGTTSFLVNLALAIGERCSPDDVHLYCIDADRGRLALLEPLPHVGATVDRADTHRVARVVRCVAETLRERRGTTLDAERQASAVGSEPALVLMIDDIGALRRELDDRSDLDGLWAELDEIVRTGGPLGICVVITASSPESVPPSWHAHLTTRLVMEMPDPGDYADLDVDAGDLPRFVPGRALRAGDSLEVQLVAPPQSIASAVRAIGSEPARERPARQVPPLPAAVTISEIIHATTRTERGIGVPIGLDMRTGDPACCVVELGETVFVTGEPRSGRSSVLEAFAVAVRAAMPGATVFTATPRGGPLALVDADRVDEPGTATPWVDRVLATPGPRVVLVDDADRWNHTALTRLAATRDRDLLIVIAGSGTDLRAHDHWTRPLQRFRHGVLLQPTAPDGNVVSTVLGPRLPSFAPHHGILVVDGEATPILAVSSLAEIEAGHDTGSGT